MPVLTQPPRSAASLLLPVVRRAAREFVADECPTRAAALAYFTALSFGPIVLWTLWIVANVGPANEQAMLAELYRLLGPTAGQAAESVLDNAQRSPGAGSVAAVVSTLTLLFTATTAFAHLQDALNRVWGAHDGAGASVGDWLLRRATSVAILLVLVVLGLASMALSTAISVLLPSGAGWAQAGDVLLSVLVLTAAFGGLFRYVPDVDVAWRDALPGAAATAVLFVAGKFAIGLYLGRASVGSSYGAAGSLLALLVWVYYSALIVLVGAELAFAWARRDELRGA